MEASGNCSYLKKATVPLLAVTDPYPFLLFFFQIIQFVFRDVSRCPILNKIDKSKSAISNFVAYLDFIAALVGSQRHADVFIPI
jgi:hypothetical protein